ncbi:MAG: hypothetical protein Kow0042_00890 [Calditrichia bacterium]
MKKLLTKYLLLYFLGILLTAEILNAQSSAEIKKFLWQRDFQELIENYAEEKIHLKDVGEAQRRIEMRSYDEAEGLRVQVLAATVAENAQQMARRVEELGLDSVYVLEEQGIYKVQVGNFTDRREAEVMLDRLRFAGIQGGWITHTTIHIPKKWLGPPTGSLAPSAAPAEAPVSFAIQLFLTNDPEKAKSLKAQFQQQITSVVWIQAQGNYWKVLAGRFTSREAAIENLQKIKSLGFADAWITQVDD